MRWDLAKLMILILNRSTKNSLYREMQHEGIICKMNDLLILLRSDYVAKYNPILEYFEQLPPWDKSSNHILEFAGYVKTIQKERFYRQLQKMLVRSIACALNPKVVNKQAMVLVHSQQNSGKTTWIRYLCPPKLSNYFTENMSLNKDGLIAITENWIINLDELAMMNKGQIDLIIYFESRNGESSPSLRPKSQKPGENLQLLWLHQSGRIFNR
jgi:predicted P-loop ATPase